MAFPRLLQVQFGIMVTRSNILIGAISNDLVGNLMPSLMVRSCPNILETLLHLPPQQGDRWWSSPEIDWPNWIPERTGSFASWSCWSLSNSNSLESKELRVLKQVKRSLDHCWRKMKDYSDWTYLTIVFLVTIKAAKKNNTSPLLLHQQSVTLFRISQILLGWVCVW